MIGLLLEQAGADDGQPAATAAGDSAWQRQLRGANAHLNEEKELLCCRFS
jgi:hypothetical protein